MTPPKSQREILDDYLDTSSNSTVSAKVSHFCDYCNKTFVQEEALKFHMEETHEEKLVVWNYRRSVLQKTPQSPRPKLTEKSPVYKDHQHEQSSEDQPCKSPPIQNENVSLHTRKSQFLSNDLISNGLI